MNGMINKYFTYNILYGHLWVHQWLWYRTLRCFIWFGPNQFVPNTAILILATNFMNHFPFLYISVRHSTFFGSITVHMKNESYYISVCPWNIYFPAFTDEGLMRTCTLTSKSNTVLENDSIHDHIPQKIAESNQLSMIFSFLWYVYTSYQCFNTWK